MIFCYMKLLVADSVWDNIQGNTAGLICVCGFKVICISLFYSVADDLRKFQFRSPSIKELSATFTAE